VLGGSTLAAKLSAPLCPLEPAAVPTALPAVHHQVRLPQDWCVRVLPNLTAWNPRMDPAEIATLVSSVEKNAHRFGIDPLTILAVIQVESQFDRFAVSPMQARGLMQVRGDTARALAAELGMVLESDDALFDIDTNVALGTYYLKTLVDRFGGLDDALAAFHAGPGFVESRRARSMPVSLSYPDRVWDAIVILERTVLV
jgi:soluble lytic murein transglycosylase-like protein